MKRTNATMERERERRPGFVKRGKATFQCRVDYTALLFFSLSLSFLFSSSSSAISLIMLPVFILFL